MKQINRYETVKSILTAVLSGYIHNDTSTNHKPGFQFTTCTSFTRTGCEFMVTCTGTTQHVSTDNLQ